MQIKIDTKKKVITVLETVKINDLLDELNEICPDLDWKNWSIEGSYDNYYQPYSMDGSLDFFDLSALITEN